jgi:glutathione synthase/RimK-type ligase-like ATP-grasp enzyme
MKRIGIITCEKFPNLFGKDVEIKSKLEGFGFQVDALIWDRKNIDWAYYDCLIFRSPWDYFEKQEQFLIWFEYIKSLGMKTVNSIEIIEKNLHKFYLKDLQEQRIRLIDTYFVTKKEISNLREFIPLSWVQIVIKPAIAAGSYLTKIIDNSNVDLQIESIAEEYKYHDILVQKFMPEISVVGETSSLYFGGKYSHSVVKFPKEGDFRIQSQYGGKYSRVSLNETIYNQVEYIYNVACQGATYGRIDGIILGDQFYLMEVELFEPDFYLELCDEALDRYINALLIELN